MGGTKVMFGICLLLAASLGAATEQLEFADCRIDIPYGYYPARYQTPDSIRTLYFEDDIDLYLLSHHRADIDELKDTELELLEENEHFAFFQMIFGDASRRRYIFSARGEFLVTFGGDRRVLGQIQECTGLPLKHAELGDDQSPFDSQDSTRNQD